MNQSALPSVSAATLEIVPLGRLQAAAVLCAVMLLAAGCSGRGQARFPGAIAPTAPQPPPPDSAVQQPTTDQVVENPQHLTTEIDASQADETATIAAKIEKLAIDLPTSPPRQLTAADLWPSSADINIPMNAQVKEFVALFTSKRKTFLEEGLSRGMQYLPMIRSILHAEELPIDLAYIPLVESAFKPMALSGAKARGIWQFMSGTGLENGLTHDWYIDERIEAEKATHAAAKYLKTLHRMFDGDWALALAAYNAGQGRVKRALKRSGHSDFWALTASTTYLPRETRNYVPLVMAAMIIARDPVKYGLNAQPAYTPRLETVTLPAAVDLRWIATWIGSSVSSIQALNPELRRWLTPIRSTNHELKVPSGTGDIIRAHLALASPTDLAPLDWHTVEQGETLIAIARKLKVTRTDLAEANYLSTRARLQIGQRLIIPRAPTLQLARQDRTLPKLKPAVPQPTNVADKVNAGKDSASKPLMATDVTGADTEPQPPEPLVHRVKRGDTLSSIARLYRTTVASLKRWNGLQSNMILVGQHLSIFTSQSTIATH